MKVSGDVLKVHCGERGLSDEPTENHHLKLLLLCFKVLKSEFQLIV